ncbi:tetratricopeptide repeat protein [Streptomyces sp. NBC_00019]|uniref:tetratricopeptide repeat protein n=1 Tax=Streptomyces sp. NBC_00019 TaxID=2975623 RepID=UPI003869FF43
MLTETGRAAEAEQLLRDTRTRVQKVLGRDHLLYFAVTRDLADTLEARGRQFEAAKLRASVQRKGTPKKR